MAPRTRAAKTPRVVKRKPLTFKQIRLRANKFLSSKQNANQLTQILHEFNIGTRNYAPVLVTVENIFTELLQRQDMYDEIAISLRPGEEVPPTPEQIHIRWLRDAYDKAFTSTLECMKKGSTESRVQAMMSAFRMLRAEGLNPMESCQGVVTFPHVRMKNLFAALLDDEQDMGALINRLQEFTEYRDVQQYGLKVLSLLGCNKAYVDSHPAPGDGQHSDRPTPSCAYVRNYLHLFEKLVAPGFPKTLRINDYFPNKDDKYFIIKQGRAGFDVAGFVFNQDLCRRYINRAWVIACKWPLRMSTDLQRQALHLLVDHLMPHLMRPVLATDILCDSLDCGPSISTIALNGMLILVTKHKVHYPDIYDRLYALFEPEIFATRQKTRLIALADVFLGSTRISESLVAAFAKRLSRLALVACPDDARSLLTLISSLLARHPGLRKMVSATQPAVMPVDPYVMDESCADLSKAINSSLWEVAALKSHFTPEVCASASRVFAVADGRAAPETCVQAGVEQFDLEVRKRFKSIEVNFKKYSNFSHFSPLEKMSHYWNMDCADVY